MAADELRVTYVKDFRDAVHEILDAPPPSSASNLWHLGRVVFVDLKGRDLGRPRAEAPHCSLELITVMVPSLQQAYVFDVSALADRSPGELVCLAVLPAWSKRRLGSATARHPYLLGLVLVALGGAPLSKRAAGPLGAELEIQLRRTRLLAADSATFDTRFDLTMLTSIPHCRMARHGVPAAAELATYGCTAA